MKRVMFASIVGVLALFLFFCLLDRAPASQKKNRVQLNWDETVLVYRHGRVSTLFVCGPCGLVYNSSGEQVWDRDEEHGSVPMSCDTLKGWVKRMQLREQD